MALRRILPLAVWSLVLGASGYLVSEGSYSVDGYVCNGTKTMIWWPDGKGPFPILLYLHGDGGGVDERERWHHPINHGLGSVVSKGFVVVAPFTGGYTENCSSATEYKDAVIAWNASKIGGTALSKGLGKVDWNKTGIWGFSMGGKTTPEASLQEVLGVGAVVCEHGARNSSRVTVPAMYLTGTEDDSSSPPDLMREQFVKAKSDFKVFSNLQNGTHTTPVSKATMNPWIAKFFGCHLSGIAKNCDAVYGSGAGSLCEAHTYAECTAVRPLLIV